ncbi:MAG: transketolase [Firmicutes bacterium]|nr:transketolase [Bacillota bacterium]
MSLSENMTVNCIRVLSAEAIQKAKSGHPGVTMGAAPMALELWAHHLRHSAKNPAWIDRDRFVLSAGHGSMLLYSLLHLFGYPVSMEDIKNFRQFGSVTPGHPEFGHTVGVDASTGPLGQGFTNAVGMAVAESFLAEKFNRPDFNIIDHYSYALCGDGCLMEGISYEAASFAGLMGLGKVIILYDSNNITIEGSTDLAFKEDIKKRFESVNWHYQLVEDGTDMTAIGKAIENAKAEKNKPSIIEIKTTIGFGSPNKAGTNKAHGEPLGEEELALTKQNLGWTAEPFTVPDEVWAYMEEVRKTSDSYEAEWQKKFSEYSAKYPELAKQLTDWFDGKYEQDIAKELLNDDSFWMHEGDCATRQSSETILNKLKDVIPNFIGGSADLAPSNKSVMKGVDYYTKENRGGANMHYGIRELAMTAIANGMAFHGGVKPYIASFFVFSDYMKPALRVSAISSLPVIGILTHDSIGVGEDGPTHQPVEQLASFRSMPNSYTFRPCDTNEAAAAWYTAAFNGKKPTLMAYTRQTTKNIGLDGRLALKGGYIAKDSKKDVPDIIIIATGSEVGPAFESWKILQQKGIDARIVSMPCVELYEEQSEEYKQSVLPVEVDKRVAVEASSDNYWYRYIGIKGRFIGVDRFGISAPFPKLFDYFGFTAENIAKIAEEVVKG